MDRKTPCFTRGSSADWCSQAILAASVGSVDSESRDPGPWGDRSAMSRIIRDRVRKQLHEAEGYLMLELPGHALAILESRTGMARYAVRGVLSQRRSPTLAGALSRGASSRSRPPQACGPAIRGSPWPWVGATSAPTGSPRPSTRSIAPPA